MEERFFALTGNEFGVHMDESISLKSRKEAEEDFKQYFEDYGCASLHEIRDGFIIRIEQETKFL